jgi:hypothetical protein
VLQLLIAATVPVGALIVVSWAFRRRTPARPEPPLAEWEEHGGRRAAAQVRNRLRGLEATEPARAAEVVAAALRRLTASQRERVRDAAAELPLSWRPDELADQ